MYKCLLLKIYTIHSSYYYYILIWVKGNEISFLYI